MSNAAILLIGGALLMLLAVGLLLALQIWLASKKSVIPGLVQPVVWMALALAGNLLPRLNGTAVESGVYGAGAIVMAVLSLLVWLIARRRFQ